MRSLKGLRSEQTLVSSLHELCATCYTGGDSMPNHCRRTTLDDGEASVGNLISGSRHNSPRRRRLACMRCNDD